MSIWDPHMWRVAGPVGGRRGTLCGLLLLLGLGGTVQAQQRAEPNGARADRPQRAATDVQIRRTVPPDSIATSTREEPYRPRRLWWGVGGAVALDAAGMVALHRLWYANTAQTRWHWYDQPGGRRWYDDWFTYRQQDKLGHVYGAWALTRLGFAYGRWSGLPRRNAVLLGMGASTVFQSQIEFFDGFSAAYGASRTDLLANVAGSALAGTELLFPEHTDWFALKYAYRPSPHYDPSATLGNAIQDYQGITFWLSLRPHRLLPQRAQPYWPDGLAIAVGHSGTGLERAVSGFDGSPRHRRQLYVGPDLDLGALLDDGPRWLRPVGRALSFVRLPLPTLQVAPDVRWHWLHF